MEEGFGHDFSEVRVHADATAAASARAVGAHAYTVGRDVVFDSNRYAPGSSSGRRLIAHELAHVVQQSGTQGMPAAISEPTSSLERDADRAADSVVSGVGSPNLQPGQAPLLAREPNGSTQVERDPCRGRVDFRDPDTYNISSVEAIDDNRKRVVLSTGRRYIVTRTPWTKSGKGPKPQVDPKADIDQHEAWVEIDWCAGATEGSIRVGANVPEQAIQLLLNTVQSGGDISSAWRQASITPTLAGVLRVKHWQVALGAQTTVDTRGKVQDVRGRAEVSTDTSAGRVAAGVEGGTQPVGTNPIGGGQVLFTFTWQPGAQPQNPPKCDGQWSRSGFEYSCTEEDVPARARAGEQTVRRTDERKYDLFFRYMTTEFDAGRNTDAIKGIAADLLAGYRVASIEGWASPEGPKSLEPGVDVKRPGRVETYTGNVDLSQRRAQAAHDFLAAKFAGDKLFTPDLRIDGRSERMDPSETRPVDGSGKAKEVEGAPLEHHVAGTFGTDPREAEVRSPELMSRLKRMHSEHLQAEAIYEALRRATITLRRSQSGTEDCTYEAPGYTGKSDPKACPDLIRTAAFPDGKSSK
jgi:hypothetical protein